MHTEPQTTEPQPREPQRSRAVFSTEDFRLIREAVGSHLERVKDSPESVKFANLYHRLGRVA